MNSCFRAAHGRTPALLASEERRPFDVISYNISLDWRKIFSTKSPRFSGLNRITLKLSESTSVIRLDAAHMRIDSARLAGAMLVKVPQPDSAQHLDFPLPQNLRSQGTEIDLDIYYSVTNAVAGGIYFYPKGYYVGKGQIGDSVFVEEDIAFTMSEPADAHKWVPCLDLPYDKAASAISIRLPNGVKGISNGELVLTTDNKDGSTTYYWVNDKPAAAYLMVANASTFEEWHETIPRVSNPLDSVRLLYYAWPPDYAENTVTDGSRYNARHAYRLTSHMVETFSRLYGEYPFKQYGQVPIQPFDFGGMEHQTMSSINRRWLRGFDEDGIAHELAHQWFGDKVTCETWADLWLNESFATFSESAWLEAKYGQEAYDESMQGNLRTYFETPGNDVPIYEPAAGNFFNVATVYSKGACVLHMLRRLIGNDTLFFNGLRDYTKRFAYGNVTTPVARDYLSGRLGRDLTNFFEDWIYSAKHPEYATLWAQSDSRLKIQISQQQSGHVFRHPIRYIITYTDDSRDSVVVAANGAFAVGEWEISKPIERVEFDSDFLLVSKSILSRNQLILGVQATQENSQLFAVKASGQSIVLTFSRLGSGEVSIVDPIGRSVLSASRYDGPRLTLRSDELRTGTYLVHYRGSDGVASQRISVVR